MGNNRTIRKTIRLTEEEYNLLLGRFKETTSRKISDYIRKVLFNRPLTVNHRDQSLDELMEELIWLRTELNALGNNFNQVVRKINSVKELGKLETWLHVAEANQQVLLDKVSEIQSRIDKFSNLWSR